MTTPTTERPWKVERILISGQPYCVRVTPIEPPNGWGHSADFFRDLDAIERAVSGHHELVAAVEAALVVQEVAHENGHMTDGGCVCAKLRAALLAVKPAPKHPL